MENFFGPEAFEVSPDIVYLNTAYLPPLLKCVASAGRLALEKRATPWKITPADFFSEAEKARQLFARLINGTPEQVALIPSASYGLSIAAKNLAAPKGAKVLLLEGEFPSNYYVWEEWAKVHGAEILKVSRPADLDWTRAVLSSLSSDVSVLSLPLCHWTDGSRLDLEKVAKAARVSGARLVVDASQAAGAMPVSVKAIDPDFLVCVGYKWLLGPYSLGLMHVATRNLGGAPIEWNWLNRESCHDFASLSEYKNGFQPGARRFDVGEKSNFILLPMLNAALGTLLGWGTEMVSRALGDLTDMVEREALSRGWEPVPGARRVPHIIGLRRPAAELGALARRLAEKKIFVSVRGDSIRVSPHLHVRPSDLDRFFSELK